MIGLFLHFNGEFFAKYIYFIQQIGKYFLDTHCKVHKRMWYPRKLGTECYLSSKLRDVAKIVCENIINETKIISLQLNPVNKKMDQAIFVQVKPCLGNSMKPFTNCKPISKLCLNCYCYETCYPYGWLFCKCFILIRKFI